MSQIDHLYYFKSTSCAPCKTVSKTISEYVKDTTAIKTTTINIDDDYAFDFCARFSVRTVPTIIAIDKNDNVLSRFDGCSQMTLEKLLGL